MDFREVTNRSTTEAVLLMSELDMHRQFLTARLDALPMEDLRWSQVKAALRATQKRLRVEYLRIHGNRVGCAPRAGALLG